MPSLAYETRLLLVRMLHEKWGQFNAVYLKGALRAPIISIGQDKSAYGTWNKNTRTITLMQWHIEQDHPYYWIETLRHEMAHQIVDELLSPKVEQSYKPHGPLFEKACRLMGHVENEVRQATHETPAVRRIKKLLALSENNPSEQEVTAALQIARKLILKHGFQEHPQGDSGMREQPVGQPFKRINSAQRHLCQLVRSAYGVNCYWSKYFFLDGAQYQMHIFGQQASVEIASYVFERLLYLVDTIWEDHKKELRKRGEKGGLRRKNSYQRGLIIGYQQKLEESIGHDTQADKAMVLHREARMEKHYTQRHPDVRSSYSGARSDTSALQAGVRDGRKLRVHQGLKRASSKGKLLSA
jgi:hypothetical protein